jgi:L-asparaginase II
MQQQQIPIAEPLVEIRRGGITESRHRGHIVAIEPNGNVIASLGFTTQRHLPPLVSKTIPGPAAANYRRGRQVWL